MKILKRKKACESLRICLLNSTANLAQFWWIWAGLAVLFSRQHLNGFQDFFLCNIFLNYGTFETHACTFLTPIKNKMWRSILANMYLFLPCSNELHNCEKTRRNLCKVVWEQLEMGLFTLGKLDLHYFSTGILYSSPKVDPIW